MSAKSSNKALWIFPICYILLDVIVRFSLLELYSWKQLGFYALSILTMVLMYFWSIFTLQRLQKRKILFNILLAAFSFYLVAGLIGSYIFFYFNGFFPNYYTFEYFKNEPYSAFILLKDSINTLDTFLFLTGFLVAFFLLKRLIRQPMRSNTNKVYFPLMLVYFGLFALLVTKIKKYDQCLIVDTNFSAAITRHLVDVETNRTFKGKGLGDRSPYALPSYTDKKDFNVLVVVFESLRKQSLGIYGYERNTTPNLSQFQKENSEQFYLMEQPYTVSTTTMLAVPGVLTGIGPYQDTSIFYGQPFLWDYGNMLNFRTFFLSSHSLQWYRFDRFYQKAKLDHLWNKEKSGKPFFNDLGVDDMHTINHLNKEIRKTSSKNFFGVVQLNATHYPYHIPEKYAKWKGSFKDEYDNSIAYQDAVIGKLLNELKVSGKLKNTVVIFTSDHGESLKDHNNIGHVDSYYIETISVPLMCYIPEGLISKQEAQQLRKNAGKITSNIDIAPTIVDLLNLEHKKELKPILANYTGYSLLKNVPSNRTIITMNNNEVARFKVGISVLKGKYHYLHRMNIVPNREEVYNIAKDPKEANNRRGIISPNQLNSILKATRNYPICKKYLPQK